MRVTELPLPIIHLRTPVNLTGKTAEKQGWRNYQVPDKRKLLYFNNL